MFKVRVVYMVLRKGRSITIIEQQEHADCSELDLRKKIIQWANTKGHVLVEVKLLGTFPDGDTAA